MRLERNRNGTGTVTIDGNAKDSLGMTLSKKVNKVKAQSTRRMNPLNRASSLRRAAAISIAMCISAIAVAQSNLPKGDAIMDKSVEAAGGKAAFEKIKSRKTTATLELAAMGLKGTVETWQAPPNKYYSVTDLGGMGKTEEGVTGDVAWQVSQMTGAQVKEGDEKALALRGAIFNAEADWRAVYKSAECVGEEKVGDKTCYKLVLTPKDGGKPETHYADKESGYIIRVDMTLAMQMGEIPVQTTFSDFRKVGDVTLAHKILQKVAAAEISITLEKFETNVEIPTDRFDLPADIQALLKKSAGATSTSAPAKQPPTPKPVEKAADKKSDEKKP